MSRQKESAAQEAVTIMLVAFLLPIWLPILFCVLLWYGFRILCLYLAVWLLWLPQGKDVLFIYSDSPIWHDYMMEQILPLVRERAVILNWSERKKWKRFSIAVQAFKLLGGDYEFNPLVMVFRPFRFALKLRFWLAFKDWKRGYTEPVERLRRELSLILSTANGAHDETAARF